MVSEAWGRIYWTMVPVDTFTRVHSTLDDSPLSIQVVDVFGALLSAAVGQIRVAVDLSIDTIATERASAESESPSRLVHAVAARAKSERHKHAA